jgi:hypothetical protein
VNELLRRYLGGGLVRVGIGDPGIVKQDVEAATGETVVQRRDLIRLCNVEGGDLNAARMFIGQIMQFGSGAVLYRPNDVPPLLQEFSGHREAKTARCADDQNGAGRLAGMTDGHGCDVFHWCG